MRNYGTITGRNEYAKKRGFELKPVLGDHYAKNFHKGNVSVWRCIHDGKLAWAVAELEPYTHQPSWSTVAIKSEHYVNHAYFLELEAALNEADSRQKIGT